MTVHSPWTPTPEVLLSEHAWARRLAFRLVQDASLADDLAQEACVRALGRAPAGGPRTWLAAVVRNLARQGRRERGRRLHREEAAARPEALPSAAEALERLAVQQDVVRAVLALEEPYRSTVVLRFYEDLPPRRIAARQGVPVATVKTRLARGLAMLRGALDREHGGDGRSWALFLLPLARTSGPAALLTGTLAMSTFVKLGVAATLLLVLAVWFARREPHTLAMPVVESGASAPEETLAASEPFERVPSGDVRASVEASAPVGLAAAEASERTVSGCVIDASGQPVPGVELGLRGWNGSRGDMDGLDTFGSTLWTEALPTGAPLAISGSDGRFTLVLARDHIGRVVSQDERWESVLTPIARVRSGEDQVLVVAPRFRLVGAVRDEDGNPLAGAEIQFGVPRARIRTSGTNLEDTLAPDWSTTSDELGLFELERLPAVAGAKLRAKLEPYETKLIEREQWLDGEVEVVLERAPGAWLEGVVESRGEPVGGAVVALGTHAKKADASGRFQMHLEGLEREPELCAFATGFLPTRISGDPNEDGTVRWPSLVRVELGGEPLTLAGTVVDAEGRPLAGQEIQLMEGRTIVHDRYPFVLESVLAGPTEGHSGRPGTKSDASGTFRLGGLEPHGYHLRVVDPRTALVTDAGPFQAGTSGLRLVQPTDRIWPLVRGVVVSRVGTPLEGLAVNVGRIVDLIGVEDSMYFRFDAGGARAETGSGGAFELRDVPMDGVRLSVNDMDVVDPELALTPGMDPLDLRVVVDRWVQLEVHAGPANAAAREYVVLDAAGEALEMETPMSGGISLLYSQPLAEGHSPVVKVSERGAVIVLRGEAGELARQAVVLRAGIVNRVEF